MIRRARTCDRRDIFNIWKTCFGDRDEYIDFFLSGAYDPERCLLFEDHGNTAAMLHLLPITLKDGVERSDGDYVFAAATLPQYRKQGLMASLLERAERESESRGGKFLSLLPANERLYDYYARKGFIKAQELRRAGFTRRQLEDIASPYDGKRLEPDKDKMYAQREDCFGASLLWNRKMFYYALEEWRFTGGKALEWDEGYCLYRHFGASAEIKEVCCPANEFGKAAAVILGAVEAESFTFYLDALRFSLGKAEPYGMIKPLGLYKPLKAPIYMNLAFD